MTVETTGSKSKELAKGLFGGLGAAKARVNSEWEGEGHYLFRIDRIKLDQNRQKQTALFVEKTCIHVFDDKEGTGHRVGDSVTHSMWNHHDSFLGNVKAFLKCVTGLPEAKIEEEHLLQIIDDDQPLNGTVTEDKNRQILTRAGNPFTLINYVREVSAEDLKKILTAEEQEAFYPDGLLDRMIELEAAA